MDLGFAKLLKQLNGAEAEPGSEAHVALARECFKMAKSWDYDFGAMAQATVQRALAFFEAIRDERPESMYGNPAVIASVVKDVVPYIVGSAWWAYLGFPVFNLTGDFFRAVRVTDFGELGPEPMNCPFPSYLVRFPEPLKDGITRGFVYPVPSWASVNVDAPDAPAETKFISKRFTLAAPYDESGKKQTARQAYTQWPEGITFNGFLNGTPTAMEAVDAVEHEATRVIGTVMDSELTKQARRVLGNTFLYINANGGLPAKKTTGADVPVEREHETAPRFRVGRPIKLGSRIRSALANPGSGQTWELDKRFIVRGHWRNQAHGPERALRRKQWIQPFWKGPEDVTEAMQRTFEVD